MKQKPLRVILNYKGQLYKLLNFFVDKKDHSFYFHIYRKLGETPMAPEGKSYQEIKKIDFKKWIPTDFPENKISFHESGFIASTDKNGGRDRDGIKGIKFDQIENFQVILIIAPPDPTQLLKFSKSDTERDIVLNLSDSIEPFSLQFFIYKKNSTKKPHIPNQMDVFGRLICCEYGDKDYGLMLAGIKVSTAGNVQRITWPPFALVLKILGKGISGLT